MKKGDMVLIFDRRYVGLEKKLAEVLKMYPGNNALVVYIFDMKTEISTFLSLVTAISDGEIAIHRLEGGK